VKYDPLSILVYVVRVVGEYSNGMDVVAVELENVALCHSEAVETLVECDDAVVSACYVAVVMTEQAAGYQKVVGQSEDSAALMKWKDPAVVVQSSDGVGTKKQTAELKEVAVVERVAMDD